MLKRIIERLLGRRSGDGALEPSPPPEDAEVRIVSDGTASGTKVYFGGLEIPNVCSIEIDKILPSGFVSANIHLVGVELDTCADTGSMDVAVDGLIKKRPIQSVDTMVDVDGTERGLKRPVLFPGEQAVYYIDGRPPVIVTELQ